MKNDPRLSSFYTVKSNSLFQNRVISTYMLELFLYFGGYFTIFTFDPMFYAVAGVAVVLTGISKSGLGGGLGQMSVPLMAMFISPMAAAAIMLPILCFIDLFNLWGYRRDWNRGDVALLLPGAIIGIGIGTMTYSYVDENAVRLLLGVVTIIFAITFFIQSSVDRDGYRPGKLVGVLCGTVSGFTSFIAHAGGAPLKFFLIPQKLPKKVFVGTHVFFFFAVNQIKIWPYLWLGQFSTENLTTSLVLAPAVPVGVLLGWWLLRVIPLSQFYRIIYILLFVAGAKLIWDGLSKGGYL